MAPTADDPCSPQAGTPAATLRDVDARAMAAVARGDASAFRSIVEGHQPVVLGYCLRFLRDEGLARDIAQEVFLTLWRDRRSYDERGKLRFYLLKTARLRCLAALKKRRSHSGLADAVSREPRTDAPAPADAVEVQQLADAMHAAIARLKPEHADLLILRHLEGLSLGEIRAVTGLREGTIKSRLSRGLAALRKELSDVR